MADDYLETFEARGHEYNSAVSFCPDAREAERQAVLDLLDCQPGQTILDAPAGGGYVAEGLNERMAGNVTILCAEPSARFAAGINDRFVTEICPLEKTGLENESVDGVVSLSGLHHVSDKCSIYREWARLIKPGGRLAIGDVGIGTGTGDFLNKFVNQHTPGGHDGVFLAAEELVAQLVGCGLQVNSATLQEVPWQFPDRATLGKFCKCLFGIASASAAETADALDSFVGTNETDCGDIQLNWQLLFAVAEKPSI